MNEAPDSPPNTPHPPATERHDPPGDPFRVADLLPRLNQSSSMLPQQGRRSQTRGPVGPCVRAERPTDKIRDIALIATLRATALRQTTRAKNKPWVTVADVRVKVRQTRTGNLILFVVDASGSMGARKRMQAVKGAILSLLLEAYQKRDQVGLIIFRGTGATLLISPTNSVEQAEQALRHIPTCGRTPLNAGLQLAGQVVTQYQHRATALAPLLVLLTDGRANVEQSHQLRRTAHTIAQFGITSLLLDCEQQFVKLGTARTIAHWLKAEYLPLNQLRAQAIVGMVQKRRLST